VAATHSAHGNGANLQQTKLAAGHGVPGHNQSSPLIHSLLILKGSGINEADSTVRSKDSSQGLPMMEGCAVKLWSRLGAEGAHDNLRHRQCEHRPAPSAAAGARIVPV
jgi:hypothetical protein